jgi:hypothetical protein
MKRYVVIFAAASCMAGGVQAAPRGVPGYFDPATRIFVPIQRHGQVDPATSTYTGTLVVSFTIAIKSALPAGDKINCSVNTTEIGTNDIPAGNYDTATSSAVISGDTATCTTTLPYSWPGLTATDVVYPVFTLVDQMGVRVSSQSLPTFKIPADGKTTTIKAAPVF